MDPFVIDYPHARSIDSQLGGAVSIPIAHYRPVSWHAEFVISIAALHSVPFAVVIQIEEPGPFAVNAHARHAASRPIAQHGLVARRSKGADKSFVAAERKD